MQGTKRVLNGNQRETKRIQQIILYGLLFYQKKPLPYQFINEKSKTTRALQKYCNCFSMATAMQFFCISLDDSSFFDVFCLFSD